MLVLFVLCTLVAAGPMGVGALDETRPTDLQGSRGPDEGLDGKAPLWGWLDPGLKDRLLAGEQVDVDEIDAFSDASDRPLTAEAEECTTVCPALPYTHIRPGAALGLSQFACTANFVFQNGDRLAIGTAGHCTVVGEAHQTLLVNAQQAIGFRTIGRTVFSTGSQSSLGNDFALIEIDPRYHDLVDPAVAVLDGPCGWRSGSGGELIQYYGHAQGWGPGGQPRTGTVVDSGGNAMGYTRLHSGGGGDSGSPVVFGGVPGSSQWREAAAVHTHGVTVVVGLPLGYGTSMPRVFEILDEAGESGWSLVDSPNCP